MGIINLINDLLWTYILVALLLGCAVWFTLRTRFVQFRMIKEMVRLLGDSDGKGDAKEKYILLPSACSENTLSGCLKTTAERKAPVSKTPFSPRTA